MSASSDARSTRREESSNRKITLQKEEDLAKARLEETLYLNKLNNSMDARDRKKIVETHSTGEITTTKAGNIKISSHPMARFEKGYIYKHPYGLRTYVVPPPRHMALSTAAWWAKRDLSLWKEQAWNPSKEGSPSDQTRTIGFATAEACYNEAKRNPKRKKLAHMSPQGKAPKNHH